ncbi:MAG: NAD(P)-binding domain-containing protein, partial [Bryobacteraceae bacterium]
KYYRRVADHYKLDVRQYELVSRIEGQDGAFVVHSTDRAGCPRAYPAGKVIISTGYYDLPNMLHVPGEEMDKVIHYYREAHPYYNHDVLVVGAKNSAAISALELYWTGARVTLIHRGDCISRAVKYWIKPNIENRIKSGQIGAYFHSRILEIRQDAVRILTPDGERWIKNDFVFAMTGYHPDLDLLERHGIRLEPETERPRTNPETLESDRPGVHLAGVIVAGTHTNEIFIENGRFHGVQIAEAIAKSLRV